MFTNFDFIHFPYQEQFSSYLKELHEEHMSIKLAQYTENERH